MLLARLFKAFIHTGSITLIGPKGDRHVCAGEPGSQVAIRLHDPALTRKILLNPTMAVGEAYMDGTLTIEEGTLYDFLDICTLNIEHLFNLPYYGLVNGAAQLSRGLAQLNPMSRSKQNVAHHYDLSGTLYDLFLDADRQYSCAYFTHPDQPLEDAQAAKKRHIAAKLLLKPGQRVLDIGCGWGGLALYLAAQAGVHVTGITLSEEQLKIARERAAKAGLTDQVSFELCDYRELGGSFDRIVSVGMFEHVGGPQYPTFFAKLHDLLAPDGVALLHSIGRSDGPGSTNPWLKKYIFPGGYSPALSEVLPVVEKKRLFITDIEILRLHYAETLKAWRARFAQNRDKVADLYDERFCRMWEFYLIGAELAFRNEGEFVFQMQLTRDQSTVPMTRDYIQAWERDSRDRTESAA
ncbi:MAG: cyclopropane-fatty-acyl-phospholipid synthase [Alphaproteobacteria bacterium]|jgi:cyclopropane-fatty-acyl-phospholipid synthase